MSETRSVNLLNYEAYEQKEQISPNVMTERKVIFHADYVKNSPSMDKKPWQFLEDECDTFDEVLDLSFWDAII
jgi:hypothetical protein